MNAYSVDLRERVMLYVESGGTQISASKLFSIGERTVRRWVKLQEETQSLKPRPHGGGYPPKIDLKVLKEYVDSNCDKTLAEIGEKFLVSANSIWCALRRINYVYKKNTSYIGNVVRKKEQIMQKQ